MQRRRFLQASGSVVGASHLAGCTVLGGNRSGPAGGDADTTEVESSDGGLSLAIPPGALQAGTSTDDISIERYGPDEMPYSLADGDLVGYRLEPDGLEFGRPITVSVDSSTDPTAVPLLFHFDDDGSIEVLGDTTMSIRRDPTGAYSASVSAEIEHFSGFARSKEGLFSIRTQEGLRQFHVGEEIPFAFTIEPSGKVYQVRDRNGRMVAIYAVVEGSRYRVNTDEQDQRFYGKNGRLVPETPLPAADLAHDETYRASQPIRCRSPGTGSYLTLRSFVEYTQSASYARAGGDEREDTIYVVYEDTYLCLEGEPTEDATVESDAATNEPSGETVRAIPYGDTHVPLSELHVGAGSECDGEDHYHAASGSTVEAIDGSTIPDPNPGGCGFGKVADVPVEDVPVR